jgi:hypothetical protein
VVGAVAVVIVSLVMGECIHSIWAGIELEMCIEKNEWLDLVHQ